MVLRIEVQIGLFEFSFYVLWSGVHYLRFDFFVHVRTLLLLLIEVLADKRFSGCH
jgi:hypothetical protein